MKFDVRNRVRYLSGRRQFFRQIGRGLLTTGVLVPAMQIGRASGAATEQPADCNLDVTLPGRLGNPDLTLLEDVRLDPRVRKVLGAAPPGNPGEFLPKVTMTSSYEDSLNWVGAMEKMLQGLNDAALAALPEFTGVVSSKETVRGVDANEIALYIDRPEKQTKNLPCIVHIHGGGMSFSSTHNPSTVRWRKTLAQQGMVVVGVEFRNAGGALGIHPFPAGLNDCASAVRWVHDNRSSLDISSIVIAGESGGGNLAIATAVKANLEGWINEIDGVFAMAPMILGLYSSVPPELLSWRENEGYQGTLEMMRTMTRVYDPDDKHEYDPLAWPFHATSKVLRGLPPHIITNYELDLIRDDGAMYARKLQDSGVSAISYTVDGAPHVPEIAMPDVIPELTLDTVGSIVRFAGALANGAKMPG